jgi:hypothetical protein
MQGDSAGGGAEEDALAQTNVPPKKTDFYQKVGASTCE